MMKNRKTLTIAILAGALAALGVAASSAQDKYNVKVQGGLALSEFRGYETWQTIAISRNEKVMAVILGNPAMINAYKAGIPDNGRPFPDGARMAKVHWTPKPNEFFKEASVPDKLVNVDFMGKTARGSLTAADGDMPCSITTARPARSSRALQPGRRRRGTMPSAAPRATRRRRREITFSRITGKGETFNYFRDFNEFVANTRTVIDLYEKVPGVYPNPANPQSS